MRATDLQELCDERGWSRARLILEMRRAARGSQSAALPSDESLKRMLRQWINGDRRLSKESAGLFTLVFGVPFEATPKTPVGAKVAEERNVSLGLTFEDDVSSAVDSTVQLLDADLGKSPVLDAAPAAGAWGQASLGWLVRPDEERFSRRISDRRVSVADVAALRQMSAAFAQMDDRFGGDYGRRAVAEFLRSDVSPILRGTYSEAIGRELFSAAAESVHLLAWMSYDAGAHGVAQRYFVRALRLAQAGGDALMAASTLDAMSHQANFLGQFRESAELARAARAGTRNVATATLTAHFYAMEARALASGGDVKGTNRALAQASSYFERRRPEDDPEWISYFNEGELAAEISHCYRDLGMGERSMEAVTRALTGSPRSDFFVTMVEAEARLLTGDVEGGCAVAQGALDIGVTMKSARCVEYVRGFRARLGKNAGAGAGKALADYAADNVLWRAAAVA